MKPHVGGDGVPRCSENECPSYDGKRCELIGCRPSLICEPAVIDMADRLRTPPVTGAEAMREAAAKVADDYDCLYADGRGAAVAECQENIAAAIRALPILREREANAPASSESSAEADHIHDLCESADESAADRRMAGMGFQPAAPACSECHDTGRIGREPNDPDDHLSGSMDAPLRDGDKECPYCQPAAPAVWEDEALLARLEAAVASPESFDASTLYRQSIDTIRAALSDLGRVRAIHLDLYRENERLRKIEAQSMEDWMALRGELTEARAARAAAVAEGDRRAAKERAWWLEEIRVIKRSWPNHAMPILELEAQHRARAAEETQ